MADRPIDTYSWGKCALDWAFLFLIKIAVMELRAQAMPHTDGWANLGDDDTPPPIEFIRSIMGATAIDDLNASLVAQAEAADRLTRPYDWALEEACG